MIDERSGSLPPIVDECKKRLKPTLLNGGLVSEASSIVIYLLPEIDREKTQEELTKLPYPVLTVEEGLISMFGRPFPADYGLNVNGILYTYPFHKRMLGYLFQAAGMDIKVDENRQIRKLSERYLLEGGTVVMDQSSKTAVLSDEKTSDFLRDEGFNALYIAPELVVDLAKQERGSWVYTLHKLNFG
jgi:hypothetical protein